MKVDIDVAFFSALEVTHHNPRITFDSEMTDLLLSNDNFSHAQDDDFAKDGQKRHKREDFEDSPSSSHPT